MSKIPGTIAFIFLMVVSTLGLAAYIIQNAYGEAITFAEFFRRILAN